MKKKRANREGAASAARACAGAFAWDGGRGEVPGRWDPGGVDGDYEKGYVLIADLDGPRLGVRWRTPPRKFDADAWALRALGEEVGLRAVEDAHPVDMGEGRWAASMMCADEEESDRDVWVAH